MKRFMWGMLAGLSCFAYGGNILYSYDSNNRLSSVNYSDGSQAFTFDEAHNVTAIESSGDADSDGLDDSWEQYYYGTTSSTNTDSDGDGFSDLAEYGAGTDPFDDSSLMELLQVSPSGSNTFVLRWASETNQTYAVARSTSLTTNSFSFLSTNIPATPPQNVYTDSTASGSAVFFYRVGVEQ